jgi:tetratricopeptide (TPR) repeat protein
MRNLAKSLVMALGLLNPHVADATTLQGLVVKRGPLDEQTPASGVDVVLLENGASDRTTGVGSFDLSTVGLSAGQRATLLVDLDGWRIQYPLDGEVRVPSSTDDAQVDIVLLPVDDMRFWSADRIEKYIERLIADARLEFLRSDRSAQSELTGHLQEWATRYGFSLTQVQSAIADWAEATKQARVDDRARALAEYVSREFATGARLFRTAAEHGASQLQVLSQEVADVRRQVVRDYRHAAHAFLLAGEPTNADECYSLAIAAVAEMSPLWGELHVDRARALRRASASAPEQNTTQALDEAYKICTLGLGALVAGDEYYVVGQNIGAILLLGKARMASGAEAETLLTRAHDELQKTLEAANQEAIPLAFALTCHNLGYAKLEISKRSKGKAAEQHQADALELLKQSLSIRSTERSWSEWASTKIVIGNLLIQAAKRSAPRDARPLLEQAASGFDDAHRIVDRESSPDLWCRVREGLGNTALQSALLAEGTAAVSLLRDSAAHYRAVLEVKTRDSGGLGWALLQNNLGLSLMELGARVDTEAGREAYAQAIDAFELALSVRTPERDAVGSAKSSSNLGLAYQRMADVTVGESKVDLYRGAVSHHESALSILTEKGEPWPWAQTQSYLGLAIEELAANGEPAVRRELLHRAAACHRAALRVYLPETAPNDFASTQNNLACVLLRLGRSASSTEDAMVDWKEARAALEASLAIFQEDAAPSQWSIVHFNLGRVAQARAARTSGAAACELLEEAVVAYRRGRSHCAESLSSMRTAYLALTLDELAWCLATAVPAADDGSVERAVTIAKEACALAGAPFARFLDTLAAAHAAAGQFADAVRVQTQAIGLEHSDERVRRLELYQASSPFSPSNGQSESHAR